MLQKQILNNTLKRIRSGGLRVTFWDGDSKTYGPIKNPKLHIKITSPKVVTAIMKNISMGVGEAYMQKQLVIVQGTLEKLLELGHRNYTALPIFDQNRVFKKISKNIKRNQAKQISHHYDLGNDFYKLWLDRSMTYSCAYYKRSADSLEEAQQQKNSYISKKLRLEKAETVLDIGSGWGSFLIQAAQLYGVKGLGITLSKKQLQYAKEQSKQAGVDKLVEFKLMNYQDLPKLNRQFDRVVSLEFLEAVGQANLATYFELVQTSMKPNGISFLQCTTTQTEIPSDAWIDKYIFPGHYVPSVREVTALLADCDFRIQDYEDLRQHYILTLLEWARRFELAKQKIVETRGERFYLMWSFWLAASISAFKTKHFELSQWTFTKGTVKD